MSPDRQEMKTILRAALPPATGAVPRKASRTMKEAVRRLDVEVDALVASLGIPFHETLQELAERISR